VAFRDLVPSYFNEEDDPTLEDQPDIAAAPLFRDRGNVEDMRKAVEQTAPSTMGYAERFRRGLLHDVGDIGQALAAPLYYGARELYRTVEDPGAQVEKYKNLIAKVADDPYGTAERVGSAAVDAFTAPYQRQPGEGYTDVLARNVLDRPLGTLMDVSAAVGIPAGLAERAGVAGAGMLADAAKSLDPLTLANKALEGTLRTTAPDALARLEASRTITDLAAEQKTRQTAIHQQFAAQAADVFSGLEPADKALFFPYVEGRLKAITEGPETGVLQELTPDGQYTPRGIDQGRLARLEDARQKYLPILDGFETQMGYQPEQYAQEVANKTQRDLVAAGNDPLAPEHQATTQQAYQDALQEATERQTARRTLSTRTSLDVQRQQEFAAKVEQIKLDQGAAAAQDYASRYPVKPATPEEAMDVWGPQGGLYFPHSGEVFTRDQVNIGTMLTKVRESVPWKNNAGTLYRTGALDTMDPEKALLRTQIALQGGTGRAEILDQLGQRFGEKLGANYAFGSDPDFRAGTHYLLRPGTLHQEAALGETMNDLMQSLLKHGDDPAVANMNMHDLMTQAASKIDTTFPLRSDTPAYKVPNGVGQAIKNWTDSFEPATNPVAKWLDVSADPFNFVTLNLRPARILNNLVGNTIFQVLQGIHPFSTTGIGAISDMAKAGAYKLGLTSSEEAGKLAKVFELPGVATGGLSGAQDYSSRTEQLLKNHPLATMLGGKQLAAYGDAMQRLNSHVETSARALSTLFELRKQSPGLMARMAGAAKTTIDLGDHVADLASRGVQALDDAGYAAALKNVNRFLNDYGRSSPIERTLLRRIFPYEKFYKHSIDLALKTPFEQPAKMALLRSLGKAAQNDFHETLSNWGFDPTSMVTPWRQDQVPIGLRDAGDGKGPQPELLNLQGPSPFSMLSGNDPGQQGLGAVHPAIKAALESALGINFFTMQPFQGPTSTFENKEVDPATGLVQQAHARPGPITQFAQQFFPTQIARTFLAGKRQPLDTSSLLDQFLADVHGEPGMAYKLDARGKPVEREPTNPLARLFVPVPQPLEAPTKQEMRGQKSLITEEYRKIGRASPALQDVLRARRKAAAAERIQQQDEQGRPYRVPLRRER